MTEPVNIGPSRPIGDLRALGDLSDLPPDLIQELRGPGYQRKRVSAMTEPSNIGPPRDTMAAEDCELGLKLLLMNQPGWPPSGRGGENHGREVVYWPTLKSYQWMRDLEVNLEKLRVVREMRETPCKQD